MCWNKKLGCHLFNRSYQSNSATIVDGMALLQMLKARNIPETFGQLADVILKNVIYIAVYNKSQRADFVTDRYPTVSTKNAERLHRAASGTYVVQWRSQRR